MHDSQSDDSPRDPTSGDSRQPVWEAEIDTPATIAVIGGGPIGIEAALYARFLGYFVLIFDKAKPGCEWAKWGDTPLPSSFGELSSSLGRAALRAQIESGESAESGELPAADERLTAAQFNERSIIPLAMTDLLYDNIHIQSEVTSISRIQWRRECGGDIQDRADDEYRLLVHSKKRGWFTTRADIVLDASGCNVPRPIGPGGGIAVGELEEASMTSTDILSDRALAEAAGRHTVVVGCSLAALVNLTKLCVACAGDTAMRITWVVPLDPGCRSASDQLQRLAAMGDEPAEWVSQPWVADALESKLDRVGVVPAMGVERVLRNARGLTVTLQQNEDSTVDIECDALVSNNGYEPDWNHTRSLAIGVSPELARPVLNPQYFGSGSPAVVEPARSIGISESIFTMEPHYYVLGAKSFGLAHHRFTLEQGHQQIREAFSWIGGRRDLDLYTQFARDEAAGNA
ncbi:MAG: hypothetical protein U0892_00385 [Pirellulales bacterium]